MAFSKWTRAKLVTYLKERDFGASGINKPQLIALAEKAEELNVPVVEADDSTQCDRSFRTVGDQLIDIPNSTNFSDILTDLPQIELADVFTHLLSACDWSTARLKQRKKDDGYKLFDQRHIDRVKVLKVSATFEVIL